MPISKLIASAALLCAINQVNAATVNISLAPAANNLVVGQTFQIVVNGQYDGPATLAGGALNLDFNPAVLRVDSVLVNSAVADFASSNGTIDNSTGQVSVIGFASFFGVAGTFKIATLNFTAIGSGLSELAASDAADPVYVWTNYDFSSPSGGTVTPAFTNAAVTVVPLPAAVFMFCPGLAGLWFVRRRSAVSA